MPSHPTPAPAPTSSAARWARAAAALALACAAGARAQPAPEGPPERLSQTGLYRDPAGHLLAADVLPFAPQYALWTDGADKRRWIRLPPGTFIDATDPAAWVFPAGTRLWKEFSFGRRVETRLLEKQADGSWSFASYVWEPDGSDALLAPRRGLAGVVETRGGARHDVPGVSDCRVCHQGRPDVVLGFGALQLSSDRDPLAPHREPLPADAVDLTALVARGLLRGLPEGLLRAPPRVPGRTPRERAALGYLAANCSGCHNAGGPLASLGFDLAHDLSARTAQAEPALRTALEQTGAFALPGELQPARRIAAGAPAQSAIVARLSSREPALQMPPLGTHVVDEEAVALLTAWIRGDLSPARATSTGTAARRPPRPRR